MPVTSLWRVKRDMASVVAYASDEKKTAYEKSVDLKVVAETMEQQGGTDGEIWINDLHAVADYAMRGNATTWFDGAGVPCSLVTGINCDPELAVGQMRETMRRFRKFDGTVAYHGYQSFSAGEGPPDVIHKIGVETARRLWGDRYQVLVATHVDHAEHLHNHIVLCAVSFVDGKKFYRSAKDYYALRQVSDELARQYGFSVLEQGKPSAVRDYTPGRTSWRKIVRADVDAAIAQARTEEHFYSLLRSKGYALKTAGKDVSVRAPGAQRFLRLERNFGAHYSRQAIRRRIVEQSIPKKKRTAQAMRRLHCRGSPLRQRKRYHGIQALYLRYCFLLGAIPKGRKRSAAKVSPGLKADLLRLNRIAEQTRMLCRNHISSRADLDRHSAELTLQLNALLDRRSVVRRAQRTAAVRSNPVLCQKNQANLAALTAEISRLRREWKLCEEVRQQTEEVREKVKTEQQKPEPVRNTRTGSFFENR